MKLHTLTTITSTMALSVAWLHSPNASNGGRAMDLSRLNSAQCSKTRSRLSFIAILAFTALANSALGQDRGIDPHFPVREPSNLSPPIVDGPIHECALEVEVSGYLPNAVVQVFANGSELIGKEVPKHPPAKIKLKRALLLNDSITATQTLGSVTSGPSYDSVPVTVYPHLTTPVVVPKIYECGQVVPAANLVASTHVEATDSSVAPAAKIGSDENTGDWDPIVTSKLTVNHHISVQQIACPNIPTKTAKSDPSAPLLVTAAPNPPPTPSLDKPIPGTTQVVLHGLLPGSQVELHYGSTLVPAGLATAESNVADVPAIPPSTPITVAQTLCTASAPSPPVVASDKPDPPILGAPICPGSHYVMVDKTTPGLNVVLLRSGSVIGYAGGSPGTLKLPVGTGVTLAAGDVVTVAQYVTSSFGTFLSNPSNAVTIGCSGGRNVVTQHNDNHRTGVYASETVLTPSAVLARGMRIKWQAPIDGGINTQPLYVHDVEFPGHTANGVFIGTVWTNKVYALNADTGQEQWVTTLVDGDPHKRGLPQGIDSTPVIDVANHRIYVAFSTKNQQLDAADRPDSTQPLNDGKAHFYQDTDLKNLDTAFWIVALDYRNGKELARTLVKASNYRSDGSTVSFEAPFQRQHPALLLDHGSLYIAFGSIAGSEGFLDYHGWVMSYRADDLSFQRSFNTSRNYAPSRSPYIYNNPDDASGIWQGGGGLTADIDGNIFFLVGNGTADLANEKYGDSFVKLTPTGSSFVPSAFVPSDAKAMVDHDADFGSGGALAIPGTGWVIGGGKPGYMYLLDRKDVTKKQQEFTATTNQYDKPRRDDTWDKGPHLHGSPSYWRGPDRRFGNLYVWGEKDYLRRYQFDTISGKINPIPIQGAVLALRDTMPGGMISISANGNQAGTGVIWATLPADRPDPHPGRLYAFNAETLQPLWDGPYPSMGHWLEPTIADGKVFVGTLSKLLVCFELGGERAHPTTVWKPYQPHDIGSQMSMNGTIHLDVDEAPMTLLPQNTLLALAPPDGVSKYATLTGHGATTFRSKQGADGKFIWTEEESSVEGIPLTAEQPLGESAEVKLAISPDLKWVASDGSAAVARLVKTFNAPEDDGPPWQLYEVNHAEGHGMFSDAAFIARVMTQGGLPPDTAPTSTSATARSAFEAQYILYKKDRH
ncbi:DUF3455 domain-containing protein [Rudaea cellulosilytica]|uniref:DUF3455 domain-containing protein n=1 Tax=Rudaea cellulosilytica TaxID=540746 RepID=UPI00146DCA9B|nr:DUF3455 domain-containing protein [Rudaea cellulosilytica]